jgi:protoheme IX farnesyltransferase
MTVANGHFGTWRDYWSLTKPRVVSLTMITAIVGAGLAALHHPADWMLTGLALAGIALVSGAAAAFNCLVEIMIDKEMRRTRNRPLPTGRLSPKEAAFFVLIAGGTGLAITAWFGGIVAAALTGFTFFGYAIVYTLFLKKRTPQNIVIGGAFGAMPPLLGWCAVTGGVEQEAMLLFLIIFVWTPPHFWALALVRQEDYHRSGLPMLPVTHGPRFTAEQILLYALALSAVSMLPYASGMAGLPYLLGALALNARFVHLAWRIWRTLDEKYCHRLFTYSISYLGLMFALLLADGVAERLLK